MGYDVHKNIHDGRGFIGCGHFNDLYSAEQCAIDEMKNLIESEDKVHVKIDGSFKSVAYSMTINDMEVMSFSKSDEAVEAAAILNDAIDKIMKKSESIVTNDLKDSIMLERVVEDNPIAPILYCYKKV